VGLIRKYFLKKDQEIITHIVKEGGIIGSGESFLTGKPSKYFVETLEPTTAFAISRKKLEDMYRKFKEMGKTWSHHDNTIFSCSGNADHG
jgi:CRP-like cAMP-binding protein